MTAVGPAKKFTNKPSLQNGRNALEVITDYFLPAIDELKIPVPSYYARTAPEIEEQKRLFYVGVTRAERYLLYVTDKVDRRNVPSRFLRPDTGLGLC